MKTYVEFIRPSKKIPAGLASTEEVENRDVATLKIPPRCDIFYFYDSPIGNTAFASTEQYNCSKFYIVARRLLTRDEAKELVAPGLAKKGALSQIIWDVRLEKNRLFALTRNGNIETVTRDNIVVDAAGKQLWPKPRARRRLAATFDVALDRDISVKKPLKLQKRPQP